MGLWWSVLQLGRSVLGEVTSSREERLRDYVCLPEFGIHLAPVGEPTSFVDPVWGKEAICPEAAQVSEGPQPEPVPEVVADPQEEEVCAERGGKTTKTARTWRFLFISLLLFSLSSCQLYYIVLYILFIIVIHNIDMYLLSSFHFSFLLRDVA